MRRQTLTNAERYVTPELRELDAAIAGAQARQLRLEGDLFAALVERLAASESREQRRPPDLRGAPDVGEHLGDIPVVAVRLASQVIGLERRYEGEQSIVRVPQDLDRMLGRSSHGTRP